MAKSPSHVESWRFQDEETLDELITRLILQEKKRIICVVPMAYRPSGIGGQQVITQARVIWEEYRWNKTQE